MIAHQPTSHGRHTKQVQILPASQIAPDDALRAGKFGEAAERNTVNAADAESSNLSIYPLDQWPNGKAPDFESGDWRFKSFLVCLENGVYGAECTRYC